MKKSVLFLLSILFSLSVFSQDSTQLHRDFFKTQQFAMTGLGIWSAGNLTASPIFSAKIFQDDPTMTTQDYFHRMNFNWNVVNGAIAGLGYWSVCRRKKKSWNLTNLEKDKKKLTTSLCVNMGLDVAYIVSGILLNRAGQNASSDENLKIGYGNSLILQGGYLLLYDAIFLGRLKKLSKKYNYNKII